MAALGWELNLGFAASDSGTPSVTINTLSTLLLLGTCFMVTFLG